jgi:hypothetical protein
LVAGGRFLNVDPAVLRLPPSRQQGADPGKLAQHIAKFGTSTTGMPPLEVTEAADGELVINSGVTRATRVAKLLRRQRSCSHKPGAPATGSRRWRSGLVRFFPAGVILPGQTVPVEVIDHLPKWNVSKYPTVKDKRP